MRWKLLEAAGGGGRKDARELLALSSGCVLMDEFAAGSGRQGSVLHGRYGDGPTLSVDLALPQRTNKGAAGLGGTTFNERIVSFFSPTRPKYHHVVYSSGSRRGHGSGYRHSTAAEQVEERAAAALQRWHEGQEGWEEGQEEGQEHCYFCGVDVPGPPATRGRDPHWSRWQHGGAMHRFCAACATAARGGKLPDERPAAAVVRCADGCAGCNDWL